MDVEDLVSHPKLWRAGNADRQLDTLPTGFEALDRALPGGGWPRKAIIEVFVEHYGIGELGLLMPALTRLEQRSMAWIAPPHIPYAPALVRFGLDLNGMLLVQPRTQDDVPWAIEEIVRAQFQSTVLAWLRSADDRTLRRLQLVIEARQAWAVFFRPMTMLQQRSPAALKLRLIKQDDYLKIDILKCRGGKPSTVDVPLSAFIAADLRCD